MSSYGSYNSSSGSSSSGAAVNKPVAAFASTFGAPAVAPAKWVSAPAPRTGPRAPSSRARTSYYAK